MKRILCACLLSLVCCVANAQSAAPIPEAVPAPSWNQLDAQQQTDLRVLADRWDRLPPWRRARILQRYEKWQRLPPEKRELVRHGLENYQRMSPEQRQKIRRSLHIVRSLPLEQQRALRAQWRALTPQQRQVWLEAGGPGVVAPPKP